MLKFIGVCKDTGAVVFADQNEDNPYECYFDIPDQEIADAEFTSRKGKYIHVALRENLTAYKRVRTVEISEPAGIKARLGIRKGGRSEVVNYLFDKKKWNMKDAKEWVEDHKGQKVRASLVSESSIARQYYFTEEDYVLFRGDGSVYMTPSLVENKDEVLAMIEKKEEEAFAELEDSEDAEDEDILVLRDFLSQENEGEQENVD